MAHTPPPPPPPPPPPRSSTLPPPLPPPPLSPPLLHESFKYLIFFPSLYEYFVYKHLVLCSAFVYSTTHIMAAPKRNAACIRDHAAPTEQDRTGGEACGGVDRSNTVVRSFEWHCIELFVVNRDRTAPFLFLFFTYHYYLHLNCLRLLLSLPPSLPPLLLSSLPISFCLLHSPSLSFSWSRCSNYTKSTII